MVGIAFFGGMVFITDLRLLGWSLRAGSISDVVEQFRVPKRFGLVLIVTCGVLMAGSKAAEYYYNPFFRAKLILLALVTVHALVFRRRVYGDTAALDRAPVIPRRAKVAAILSLLLWTSVICCGRSIGYVVHRTEPVALLGRFISGLWGPNASIREKTSSTTGSVYPRV
jgi:hypothetical protein